MTALRLVVLMRGTAFLTYIDDVGRESTTLFSANSWRQLRSVDAIGPTLVVNQAVRPKLGDRDEPCAL
jgi:hypothetical protein